jgi:hypothetical protein
VPARVVGYLALALGIALAVALAIELAAPLSAALHHDFLAFYGAGRLIGEGDPSGIYDAATLTAVQRAIVPGPVGVNGYMPYINPPFAAVGFAPLAGLAAEPARAVWAGISAALLAIAAVAIAHPLRGRDRAFAVALIVLSYPAYHALAEGQWSILLLASGVATIEAARRDRWWLAGLALVPFWIKPQLIVLPLLGLIAARRWRIVAGAVVGGAALAAVALPVTGIRPYGDYASYLVSVVTSHFAGAGATGTTAWRGDLATTEGINGLVAGYLGQGAVSLDNALWLLGSGAVAVLYAFAIRRTRPGFGSPGARRMLATGLVVTLLVNPNLFSQDCLLVFLVLPVIWPVAAPRILPAVIATTVVADLIVLDQWPVTVHLFSLVLIGAVVVACLREIRGDGLIDPGVTDAGASSGGTSSPARAH